MIDRARLRDGAERFGVLLSEEQLTQFERYQALLAEWNERINLTAITEPEDVVIKHFLDSLSGATMFVQENEQGVRKMPVGTRLIDVGTGAGFPGLALAIAFPEGAFTLIDATGKKVRFLEMVAQDIGLHNVIPIQGRAEELAHDPAYREQYDFVLSRAVASMPVLLEYMVGFCKQTGRIVTYKGPNIQEEMNLARSAIRTLGLTPLKVQRIDIENYAHTVAVFKRRAPLNDRYPRSQAQIKKKAL